MASTTQSSVATDTSERPRKHVHHGRTVAAWVGAMIATLAFVVGGVALIIAAWPLFWIAVVMLIAAPIIGKILQKMGHGAY